MVRKDKNMAERILCVMGKIGSGGIESIVFSYYSALDKSKFQYDIVYEDRSDRDVPEELIQMGARAFKIPAMSHPRKYLKALRVIIRKGNYKIIHCNTSTLSVLPLWAAKTCGVPVRILHNHSTSSKYEFKRDLLKKVLRLIAPRLANKWCACSELSGRWMYGDKAFKCGKVTVFRNAVDIERFRFDESARIQIRRELEIENKTVVGHIGRFMTQKNHLFLIDIFAEYKKINNESVLLLVGEGPTMNEVREYVKKKNLYGSVYFIGVLPDTSKMYSAFDIFLLPSLYEGLPVVSVEASAAGLSQIISDKVTKECKITDAVTFLPIDDPLVWAYEIDKNLTRDRAATFLQMQNSAFNMDICVRELEDYYSDCLKNL